MPANAEVRARVDAWVKEEAAALPFDPLTPNAETVEAMKAARRGELVKVGSAEDLLADLHADD
jgi:antitoxin component of RelBE/YafQ-DinJ toxin-antitoxin module